MSSPASTYPNNNNNNMYTNTFQTQQQQQAGVVVPFLPPGFDPNTTFVQADPTTFREVVQKLTGKPTTTTNNTGKLHERRRATGRKLEIQLNNNRNSNNMNMVISPSPVSTLEFMPRSPMAIEQEEERAIAEKGFYFHPSPITTPRGSDPPQLLPLFPLSSPTSHHHHSR